MLFMIIKQCEKDTTIKTRWYFSKKYATANKKRFNRGVPLLNRFYSPMILINACLSRLPSNSK